MKEITSMRTIKHSIILALLVLTILLTQRGDATTITVTTSKNWSTISPLPTASDIVVVNGNFVILTVDVNNAVCDEIKIGQSATSSSSPTSTLKFAATGVLAVRNMLMGITSGNNKAYGSLDMTSGGYLSISGTMTITKLKTFTAGTGTIEYNGSAAQTVRPFSTSSSSASNKFYQLMINNAAGASMSSSFSVTKKLTLKAGALNLSSKVLTLSAGDTIVRIAGSLSATPTFGTSVNVVYDGSGTMTTGYEIPSTDSLLTRMTIKGVSAITAGKNFTIRDTLDLQSANPSGTKGCLDMGSFTLTLRKNYNSIAAIKGIGDVTGIVTRSSIVANTSYSFGNKYTTLTFSSGYTLPTSVSVKTVLTASAVRTGSIMRYYDIIQSGGSSNTTVNLILHYLDTELNGNTTANLDIFSYQVSGSTWTDRSCANMDNTNKWVAVGNLSLTDVCQSSFGSKYWTLSNSALSGITWSGTSSTAWSSASNWVGGVVPGSSDAVVITASANAPVLPSSTSVKSIKIESGATLNGGTGTTLTLTGDAGAWNNSGTFNAGTSTIVFSGTAGTLSGTTNFYNVTVSSGKLLTLGTSSIMRISGTLTVTGTLNAAANPNTIEYNGADQIVVNPNGSESGYHHLILSGSGTKTMPASSLNLKGSFNLSGSVTAFAGGDIHTTEDFNVESGATFHAGSHHHSTDRHFTNDGHFNSNSSYHSHKGHFKNHGSFDAGDSHISMDGNSDQRIETTVPTSFKYLAITNPVSATLGGNIVISGSLQVDSGGVLDLGTNTCNSEGGGKLVLAGTLKVGGTTGGATGSNFPTGFDSVTVTGGGVDYTGTGQTAADVPGATVIVSGTGTQIPGTLDKFAVDGNYTLASDMTITGTLTLTRGVLTLGDKNLILEPGATIVGAPSDTNFIDGSGAGQVRRKFTDGSHTATFTFPIGTSDAVSGSEYSPVTVNFTSGTYTSGYVGVNVYNQKHPSNGSSTDFLDRYWTITSSGVANYSCDITFQYQDTDVDGTEANIKGKRFGGSSWLDLTGSTIDDVNHTLSGTVTTFGTFTGTQPSGPLPVELTSFTGSSSTGYVALAWSTATETNNYGFEIQRTAVSSQQSGNMWSKIGFVEGHGTSNAPKSYSFSDKNIASGKYSYRLKQVDRDGKCEYSKMVEVTFTAPKIFALEQNYPNPFNPTTAIGYHLSANGVTTLKIYDAIGREVATLVNEVKDAGTYTAQFDGAKLSSGIYFARLTSSGKTQIRKLMLMK